MRGRWLIRRSCVSRIVTMRSRSITLLALLALALGFAYASQLEKVKQTLIAWSHGPDPVAVPILNSPFLLASMFGLLVQMVIVLVLVQAYLRTRNKGFVWLGVAVVAWPFVSGLLDVGQRYLIDRMVGPQTTYQVVRPHTMLLTFIQRRMTLGELMMYIGAVVGTVKVVVGGCLLLVAVVYLGRRADRATV